MKKRLLWLYNHSTLIKSEVPIIRELGYEVYIPKIPPFDVSITIDWESDKLLTVPQEALDILNEVDFYNDTISKEAMAVMNEYFDVAIFGCFPQPLQSIILEYTGILIMHPFGLEKDASYTGIIRETIGDWLLLEIEKRADRFWFGQSYENLLEVECELFKRRVIDLPIGMLDTTIEDKWNGKNGKVLFICPRIKINSYYAKVYKEFKKNFAGIDYSIGGAQPIMVEEDKSVMGYLNQKEYDELYTNHSVMYYHSTEPRHVHYHPFEAIKQGLPLIFMAGGLLDELGGKNLPGRCNTIKEARKKCKRIISGDKGFINAVKTSQTVLLDAMSYDKCKEVWRKNFAIIENWEVERAAKQSIVKKDKKRLGLIIPIEYKGGVLDYTKNLAIALKNSTDLDIVVGYPEYDKDIISEFNRIDVCVRTFKWDTVEEDEFCEIMGIMDLKSANLREKYCVMNDGMHYFADCDAVLFMADRVPNYYLSLKPYGVIVHDYIQRYEPDIMGKYYEGEVMSLAQNALACFTTSRYVLEDCIQYAGVVRKKMHLLPLFFNDININAVEQKDKKKYFCWTTNVSKHKNHNVMLDALIQYYEMGGKLDCYVTGVDTDLFASGKNKRKDKKKDKKKDKRYKYIQKINERIDNNDLLKKHMKFLGNLSKTSYYRTLKGAKFLVHPGYADNGNGATVDAALLGVPVLSSDYPGMRNIEEQMEMGITFFDRENHEQIAELMLDMELHSDDYISKMKSIEAIKHFTVSNQDLCKNMATVIRHALHI